MAGGDPETLRLEMLERWERAAAGWGRRAANVREWGMPVSAWMVEQLALQPGQRVLDLAAGPGDTGFLAAELVRPGGTLISSDAAEAMLEIARGRAAEAGVDNVEFKRLELEWIDLSTASVDAVLCRFGVMLSVDPAAALREIRRVLRPGGRAAVAVWDRAEDNPWATIPSRALIELGHAEPPDPAGPGMFVLADHARLRERLEEAGFLDVWTESIDVPRAYASAEAFVAETLDCSHMFAVVYRELSADEQARVSARIAAELRPFAAGDGSLVLPGRALGAAADA
ncbi:MAG: methyltransferase domain-containing protein [Solirubrobacterales bacterium]|nr:methyltransferase domain-containing protein [Solirubrobacterales bacterium]MBV9716379.1 methyltransferase domain-containing protein [Solirubrobacterales bacterium]